LPSKKRVDETAALPMIEEYEHRLAEGLGDDFKPLLGSPRPSEIPPCSGFRGHCERSEAISIGHRAARRGDCRGALAGASQ